MRITKIECWPVEMKLSEPYTIAYETVDRCTNIFLRCQTDTGLTGMGCAAPDKAVTNETPEGVMNDYRSVIEPFLLNSDPFRYLFILEHLKSEISQSPSSQAMVDMMLFDLVSRKAQVPLYKYLGGFRESIPTSITVGIMPLDKTLSKAVEYIGRGFQILKVKGGVDVEEDIEKILRLREKVGRKIQIRFDANQGYTADEAIHFVEATRHANLELIEQPTPRENLESLGKVSQHVHIPVMADESLMNLRDVFRLIRKDLTDMINIKLMKVGGISEALYINSVARAAGVESMIGCMDESALAISAGLHVALARPNIAYADLDGHLDLVDDPAADSVILKNGILYPSDKPGLGFIF
jgi:L-alanine-DL-glutamate epimerase-like enolase superfamily enzyme